MKSRKRSKMKKYAPIVAVGFTTTAALMKSIGQRYLVSNKISLRWRDIATVLGGALVGYVGFRIKHGNAGGAWYTR